MNNTSQADENVSEILVETLLTVSETQKALKLSESAVRKLLGRRALPYVKINSSVRIRASDLAAFIAERTVAAQRGRN